MEKPDTISIAVTHRDQVVSDKADIHVTIKGSSLLTGNAALKKAKEVSQLVAALAEIGVKEQDVVLQGIHAENSSGILGKTTSAMYQLRIRCEDLESLADILGVVTAQKNVTLDSLAWRYPDGTESKKAWLHSCLEEAKIKAEAIASALGVKLIGVHAMTEKWLDSEQNERMSLRAPGPAAAIFRAARAEPVDVGFPLSHSKWVEVQIDAQFRVSEFTSQ